MKDGKKKQLRQYVEGATKKEVQDKLLDLQNRKNAGTLERSKATVGELLDEWLNTVVHNKVDPRTERHMRQRVRDFILPTLGHDPLTRLTPGRVGHLYKKLEEDDRSADTRNKAGQLLRQALEYAVREGYVHRNVAKAVPLPKVEGAEISPLTEEQVKRLLEKAEKRQSRVIFILAIDSGMRQGELLALEWLDVDLEAGTVQVKRTVRTDEKGGPRVKDVKTKAARRTIRLSRKTVEALASHRAKAAGKLVFPAGKKGPFDSADRYLNKRNLQLSFKRALRRAGLPDFRFHDLRTPWPRCCTRRPRT